MADPKNLLYVAKRAEENNARVLDLVTRIREAANYLLGPQPSEVPTEDGRHPEAGIVRRIEATERGTGNGLSEISSELSRIEDAIGHGSDVIKGRHSIGGRQYAGEATG